MKFHGKLFILRFIVVDDLFKLVFKLILVLFMIKPNQA